MVCQKRALIALDRRKKVETEGAFSLRESTIAGSLRIDEHSLERRLPEGISMKRLLLCVVALAAMFGTGARAQDLSGNWQGTLKAGKDLRFIFNFYKGDKDPWNAKMYSIDQGGQVIPVTSVAKHESSIKISVDMIGGTFEGKLSEDGKTITGTWTQGRQPLPLTLVHATPEPGGGILGP